MNDACLSLGGDHRDWQDLRSTPPESPVVESCFPIQKQLISAARNKRSCTAAGLTIFTAAQLGAAEVLGQEFVFRIFSLFPIEGLLKL